tara:strand:+ start:70 stop:666 length:597 start_codon:yes stop_codon:yes gene_type:complete
MTLTKLLIIFTLTFTQISFARGNSSAGLNCLQTSRFVLFTKAINTLTNKYQQHISEQFDRGHYSSFEYTKLRTDKSSLLPKSLCKEDIVISIKEFTKAIKTNCMRQADIEEIKIYTREIASDISGSEIKNTHDSLKKAIPAAIDELKDSIDAFTKCNKKKNYIRKISSINLYGKSKNICFSVVDIMNQARIDKGNCSK